MNLDELTEKSEEACDRLNGMVKELFGDVETGEDGDGDAWFVAAIHVPSMPAGGVMSFSSLPYAESVGAATMLSLVFSRKAEEREMSFVVRGFNDRDGRRLAMVEAYRRHYAPDSLPGQTVALLDQFDAAEPGEERDALRERIVAKLEEIQAEADADLAEKLSAAQEVEVGLAMSDPANWGSDGRI